MARALGCGPSTQGSLASYDPGTSSWKTSQLSLFEALTECSVTWPRSGTMRGGTAYPLPPSAPLTVETGSTWSRGEYPTPSATDYGTSQNEGEVPHERPTAGTPSLSTWARSLAPNPEQWPTPTASRSNQLSRSHDRQGEPLLAGQALKSWPTPTKQDGSNHGSTSQQERNSKPLNALAASWPTPTAGDAEASGSRNANPDSEAHPGTSLTDATCRAGHQPPTTCTHGGECKPALNPRFVEWLQGFPMGWTELTAESRAALASELSATRLSRRSQK